MKNISVDLAYGGEYAHFKLSDVVGKMSSNEVMFQYYGINLNNLPKSLFNFMFGILMSEQFGWDEGVVEFDELTENQLQCINDHVIYNHKANPYNYCSKKPMEIVVKKIVGEEMHMFSSHSPVICSQGMGKDGLANASLALELGEKVMCYTIENEYATKALLDERKKTIGKFYSNRGIGNIAIEVSISIGHGFKIRPWWILGLPLAYYYKAKAVLYGNCLDDNKFRNGYLIRPNFSVMSTSYISEVAKINIISPFLGVSDYGVQKFLWERYPDTMQYQRSCMHGMPHCGQCPKCYAINTYAKAWGYYETVKQAMDIPDMADYKHSRINPLQRWSIINAEKKNAGNIYSHWIENINYFGQMLSFRSVDTKEIFLQHLGYEYENDPGYLGGGYDLQPSRWVKYMMVDPEKFWKGEKI